MVWFITGTILFVVLAAWVGDKMLNKLFNIWHLITGGDENEMPFD